MVQGGSGHCQQGMFVRVTLKSKCDHQGFMVSTAQTPDPEAEPVAQPVQRHARFTFGISGDSGKRGTAVRGG